MRGNRPLHALSREPFLLVVYIDTGGYSKWVSDPPFKVCRDGGEGRNGDKVWGKERRQGKVWGKEGKEGMVIRCGGRKEGKVRCGGRKRRNGDNVWAKERR